VSHAPPPPLDDALATALGHAAPAGIERLDPAARAALARLVGEAREHQKRQVKAAIDEALTHVPSLLRVAIRKLLFG